jgi:hypothetical protein
MQTLLEKYQSIIDTLDDKKKRYIHFKSLNNFIIHIDEFKIHKDEQYCEQKINEYLEIIANRETVIDSATGVYFFEMFISPLGNKFKELGFKSIVPIKYLFLFSLMIDSLLYIGFFILPYPIVTICVCLYNLVLKRRLYHKHMVYGIYY